MPKDAVRVEMQGDPGEFLVPRRLLDTTAYTPLRVWRRRLADVEPAAINCEQVARKYARAGAATDTKPDSTVAGKFVQIDEGLRSALDTAAGNEARLGTPDKHGGSRPRDPTI